MNIVTWVKNTKAAVSYYRVWQFLERLHSRGHNILEIPLFNTYNADGLMKNIKDSDVVILGQELGEYPLKLMRALRVENEVERIKSIKDNKIDFKKLYFVYTMDDDILNVSPWVSTYVAWGKKNWHLPDGTALWESGKTKRQGTLFDINRNRKAIFEALMLIKECDMLVVTTEALKRKYKRFNANTIVVPNGVDTEYMGNVLKNDTDKVRIYWGMSPSHYEDWQDIGQALGDVLKRNKNVTLVTQGKHWKHEAIDETQREHHNAIMDIRGYWTMLRALRIDIGLAHLSDSYFNKVFNKYKSPVKWEEYGALKIPALLPNIVYSEYVEDSQAVFYKDKEDFKNKLQKLIDNKDLRKRIGENAHKRVSRQYDIEKVVDIYEYNLKNMITKKEVIKV